MFARTTTITGDPDLLDEGIEYIRDIVWPEVREKDGFVGISLIADRANGRCIATTSWTSEEAMLATEAHLQPLRAKSAMTFGGVYAVDHWEIALMHRMNAAMPGAACVRVTWSQCPIEQLDTMLELLRTEIVPRLETLAGFCSISVFVDRSTGRLCASTTYESAEASAASREAAMTLRAEATQPVGARVLDIAECELMMAHLHVPELV